MKKLPQSVLRVQKKTDKQYLRNVAADIVRRLRKQRCAVCVHVLINTDEDMGTFAAMQFHLEALIKQQAGMGESFEAHYHMPPRGDNEDACVSFTRAAR